MRYRLEWYEEKVGDLPYQWTAWGYRPVPVSEQKPDPRLIQQLIERGRP